MIVVGVEDVVVVEVELVVTVVDVEVMVVVEVVVVVEVLTVPSKIRAKLEKWVVLKVAVPAARSTVVSNTIHASPFQ